MLFMRTVLQKLSGLGDANNTSPSSWAGLDLSEEQRFLAKRSPRLDASANP